MERPGPSPILQYPLRRVKEKRIIEKTTSKITRSPISDWALSRRRDLVPARRIYRMGRNISYGGSGAGVRKEDAPLDRITMGPTFAHGGDIYNGEDERSLSNGDGAGPRSIFLGSAGAGMQSRLGWLNSSSGENARPRIPGPIFFLRRGV